jgi:hypothetical protein
MPSAIGEPPYWMYLKARKIKAVHRGVIDQHVDHGWHVYGVRHLLVLHCLQAVGDVEARHEDMAPTTDRDAEGRRAVGKMEHRGGV